ncbi:MAG TPA: FAD binding domain-containing protein [Candidatus Saccharimonadales bacterium]|nr:FAD binding domain-containing protein [Candidatus Saccharimonadales bacterium]
MKVDVARDLDGALALLAADPEAVVLHGGTDLMVEINFGRRRPAAVVAIDRVAELRDVSRNGTMRLGAGVTFTTILEQECGSVALREAARTVGSPQIRNAATIGGNVATSSPAGDSLPVLAALDATVHLRSLRGERTVRFAEFMTGPKKNVRAADELVTALEWNDAGPSQVFMKVGTRNAMVIAVAGLALVADRARKRVGIALGSCGPTILRASEAEAFAAGLFDEHGWNTFTPTAAACAELGARVAAASRPIDDVRGTAAYRRHVLSVLGGRALARVARMA